MDSETAARVQRLKTAMEARGVTGAELARRIGSSRQYVSALLAGEKSGKLKLPAIAKALSVDLAWLATGGGGAPTWAGGSPVESSASPYIDGMAHLAAAERAIIAMARQRGEDASGVLKALETARKRLERL
jgi:transcriptional regulator with XRE-family HTH domain